MVLVDSGLGSKFSLYQQVLDQRRSIKWCDLVYDSDSDLDHAALSAHRETWTRYDTVYRDDPLLIEPRSHM